MYSHVIESEKSIMVMHDKFRSLATELFPGQKFVKWEKA